MHVLAVAARPGRAILERMPRFAITPVAETRDLAVQRAVCDGCDGPRPCEEHIGSNRVWLLTAGCFELRDRDGRRVIDPATLLVLPAGHAYTIRHPGGPDTCVSFRGPLVDAIAARGSGARMPAPREHARLLAEVAAWRRGDGDDLALAEALCAASAPPATPGPVSRREREVASDIADRIRVDVAAPTSLTALAAASGLSTFHACRVFRRVTGVAIHRFRREVRLRHALALLVDGHAPIADVAAATGFASQSHLTNRFRERFGTTPARIRVSRGREITASASIDRPAGDGRPVSP